MVRTFCKSGNHEVVKGGVHGAAGVIAAMMAMYNLTAWCFRGERHLRLNALIYMLAVGWEVKQTLHHFRKEDAPPALPCPNVHADAA